MTTGINALLPITAFDLARRIYRHCRFFQIPISTYAPVLRTENLTAPFIDIAHSCVVPILKKSALVHCKMSIKKADT